MDRQFSSSLSVTVKDLLMLGVNDLAYVKAVNIEGRSLYAIHAADGTPLTVVNNREVALATIRQHEMEAVSLN